MLEDSEEVSIGEPAEELPSTRFPSPLWVKVAEAVDAANGAWVPITIKDANTKKLAEYSRRIKTGEHLAFQGSAYNAVQRRGVLWIKRVDDVSKS